MFIRDRKSLLITVSPATQFKALVLIAVLVIALLAAGGCKSGQGADSTGVGDRPGAGETGPVNPSKPGKTGIPPGSHTLERFDLRDFADLTPVKAQGETGGCWAFASIAALESHLAYVQGTVTDLSENNLMTQVSRVYDESYDRDPGSGGDDAMATGYYVAWRGPVSETDDPFPASAREEDMVVRPGMKPALYVQEVLFLPEREGPLDNEEIKRAITEYGGIAAAMWKGSPSTFGPYYNEDTFAWYYDKPFMNEEGNGHAVTIVGWDDTFPKENFKITPPGDGAFIVRNTKGPNWGSIQGKESMGGYFYVSYYDPMFMTKLDSLIGNHVFAKVSESRPYDRIYQHDLLGYNYRLDVPASPAIPHDDRSAGSGGSPPANPGGSQAGDPGGGFTASFASVFKATSPYGEQLKAVGFYTLERDVQYEVLVARGFAGESLVDAVPVAGGIVRLPGYHTVDFETPVSVSPESKFAVVVRLTASVKPVVAADSAEGLYVKKSVSSPGESYILQGGKWTDLYEVLPDTNVCLKAFSDDGNPPDTES